jgi:transposase
MLIPIDIWTILVQNPPELLAFVQQLILANQDLAEENARLRERVNRNAGNSHTPPSRNIFVKPQSLRRPSGKKPGGQPGHVGRTLHWADDPDEIIEHRPQRCEHCQAEFAADTPLVFHSRRQEMGVIIRKIVQEHRSCTITCPICQKKTTAEFPPGIEHYVQYGATYKALMLYLNQGNFIPFDRLATFSRDVLQIPVSVGTLNRFVQEAAPLLDQSLLFIREKIRQAPVAQFDETGTRVDGTLKWRHSASTAHYTLLHTHNKRGREAMDEVGILPDFAGCAVHDCWQPYFGYNDCEHALCNAHLLRELTGIEENDQQSWPVLMKEVLLDAKMMREEQPVPLPAADIDRLDNRYDEALRLGFAENPLPKVLPDAPKKRGRKAKSKARNLLERMDQFKNNILLFLRRLDVPFDNNLSERDLRMSKTQQKVSGCFRSDAGCAAFDRYHSYVSSARKQAISTYDATLALTSGRPYFSLPP